jgi:hypothetical protein
VADGRAAGGEPAKPAGVDTGESHAQQDCCVGRNAQCDSGSFLSRDKRACSRTLADPC